VKLSGGNAKVFPLLRRFEKDLLILVLMRDLLLDAD